MLFVRMTVCHCISISKYSASNSSFLALNLPEADYYSRLLTKSKLVSPTPAKGLLFFPKSFFLIFSLISRQEEQH